MKEQTAVAPVNTKKLEEFYVGLHKEIADKAINNPGWETDVTKTQEMYCLMDQIINNTIVKEDQEVQQQWNATKEAYNKGDLKKDEYEFLAAKYDAYKNTGGDPYVFANPKRKDMPEILQDLNEWLKPQVTETTDPTTGKITKTSITPNENIHMAAVMGLRDPDIDFVISKRYNTLPPEDSKLYKSKTEYFEMLIKAGEVYGKEAAGYDERMLAAYKKSLDGSAAEGYHRFYQNQVYEPLRTNGETASDQANIAFTEAGALKQPLVMGANGRNFKVYGKGSNNITDLNIKGNVVTTGAGKVIDKGGVPWVQTQVLVSLTDDTPLLDASGKPVMREMDEKEKADFRKKNGKNAQYEQVQKGLMAEGLLENGFTVQKVTDAGLLESLGMNGQVITSDIYVGTILLPADFSEANRIKYDNFYNTETEVAKGAAYYDEKLNVEEVIKTGNIAVASSLINKNVLKDMSTELDTQIDNLSWRQDEADPYVFYSEDTANNYKYDFRTNEWFHSAR